MKHARHDPALHAGEQAMIPVVRGDHYIVIVWDGPTFAGTRAASFCSDAPLGDVKLICKAVAEQINDGN